LLRLRARDRHLVGHVPLARPRPPRAQRDRHLVAPPRRIRQPVRSWRTRRRAGPATATTRSLRSAAMAAGKEGEQAEPEVAAGERLGEAGRHKTIATVRAGGGPRISGIECAFADGELRFGSMPGARKGADLRRDPRFALHGPAFHPQEGKEAEWPGEAKIAGRA